MGSFRPLRGVITAVRDMLCAIPTGSIAPKLSRRTHIPDVIGSGLLHGLRKAQAAVSISLTRFFPSWCPREFVVPSCLPEERGRM
jgi:hypothetical protein